MYDQLDRRLLPAYFKALANPTRLRMVELLSESGEESVTDLAESMRMSQPRVSWHLALLRRGGVVTQRREGRQVYCSLDRESLRRFQLAFWELLDQYRRIEVRKV
ncbi:MAG: ArsR/SmtB family transcription factor [Candidatus Dormibacteraceae bacterium]|nr:metalloregulator ArsR/SmtB family transcription factor [Candidatus Acidoferrales bacterium]